MTHEKDAAAEARREKYGHLPPPVRIEDTVISQETQPARDSKGARRHRLGIHKRDRVLTSRKPTCVLGHFPTGPSSGPWREQCHFSLIASAT